MDSLSAFAMGEANRNRPPMVFDWDRAARRIRESGAVRARAGLAGDWEWTGGVIYEGGVPVPQEETYTYLSSVWAVPELELDGALEDCYRVREDDCEWDAETYWPSSARVLLAEPTDD